MLPLVSVKVNGIMNFTQYQDILAKNLVASVRRLKLGLQVDLWGTTRVVDGAALERRLGLFAARDTDDFQCKVFERTQASPIN